MQHRKAIYLALSLTGFLSVTTTTHAQTGSTVPLSEYRQILSRAETTVADGLTPEEATRLASTLRPLKTVTLPDGTTITLKNEAVLSALDEAVKPASLKAGARKRKDAADSVRSLAASIGPARVNLKPADNAPQQAAKIVARKEFTRYNRPDPVKQSWWSKMWEKVLRSIANAIGKFLESIFKNLPRPKFGGGPIKGFGDAVVNTLYFLAIVAVAVALYFLGRLLYIYLKNNGHLSGVRKKRKAGDPDFDLTGEGIADPLAAAQALAAQGDYRGALRLAYIAGLRKLQTSGLLRLEENKTNWEYQRMLRSKSPEAYKILLPATRLFDFVWYGCRPATREQFDAVVTAHDQLPDAPPPTTEPTTTSTTAPSAPTATTPPAGSATAPPTNTAPRVVPPAAQSPRDKENPW